MKDETEAKKVGKKRKRERDEEWAIINEEIKKKGQKGRKQTRNEGGGGGRLFKYNEAVELSTSAMSYMRVCQRETPSWRRN
jgi:hypothetical protein